MPAEKAGAEDIKRIGIYDSRSVAIAFVGSEVYKKTRGKLLAAKMDEQRKAREEGDKKKLEELEAWGKAQQELLHRQGFSTAPVDDILAHISGPLAEIRKEANVQLLISKWDRKKLALHESAETVDVTVRLVDAFKPNERQRKHALEIRKHDPVPLDELKDDPE
ncbi:MAG: hypothetical protein HKO57_16855 [Akkermansiaceae bacterium]|nr:hypothetical protein [Akkermansiaceae bacterium]